MAQNLKPFINQITTKRARMRAFLFSDDGDDWRLSIDLHRSVGICAVAQGRGSDGGPGIGRPTSHDAKEALIQTHKLDQKPEIELTR